MCDQEVSLGDLGKLDGDDIQQIGRDIAMGRRDRRFAAKVKVLARKHGFDGDVVWEEFLPAAGLPPYKMIGGDGASLSSDLTPTQIDGIVREWLTDSRKDLALKLGLVVVAIGDTDWQGLIDFMNALVPIIAQFMAMCGGV